MFFIKNGIEGYRKAFRYKGIAGRRAYFFFALFQLVIYGLIALISFYLSGIFQNPSNVQTEPVAVILASVGFFIALAIGIYSWLAGLAFSVRRLHDVGLSGWILLIPVVIAFAVGSVGAGGGYVVNAVFGLGLMMARTREDNNKYRPENS
jgi:uncharacterized membrane protein YhaH (DUF805 family)